MTIFMTRSGEYLSVSQCFLPLDCDIAFDSQIQLSRQITLYRSWLQSRTDPIAGRPTTHFLKRF